MVQLSHKIADAHDLPGWRKIHYRREMLKKRFAAIRTAHQYRRNRSGLRKHLRLCEQYLAALSESQASESRPVALRYFLDCAKRLLDQTKRRLLEEQTIPHAGRRFVLYMPWTRWIN